MNIYSMKKPKKINAVSITVALFVLILAYTCWFLVPMFWPVFQLTGIMRGACNDAYRERNNEKVIDKLLRDARRTKLRLTKENFRFTRVEYTPDELNAIAKSDTGREFLQSRGKACIMELYYEDDYTWPLIGKSTHMVFERKIEQDLAQVKWEKTCTCVTLPRKQSP